MGRILKVPGSGRAANKSACAAKRAARPGFYREWMRTQDPVMTERLGRGASEVGHLAACGAAASGTAEQPAGVPKKKPGGG